MKSFGRSVVLLTENNLQIRNQKMPPNSENANLEATSPPVVDDIDHHHTTATTTTDDDDAAADQCQGKCIVKYRKNFYDITRFLHKHPGGINTLRGLENADMTARFMRAPPHSDAAMYLMKEYQIKTTPAKWRNGRRHNKEIKENIEIVEEEIDDVAAAGDKHNNNGLDDSMEHLVDWSKAMLPQIAKITPYYNEWVHKPVDRPLRLFGPWYLEMCTKTPWWLVPAFWIPVITSIIYNQFQEPIASRDTLKLTLLSIYFIMGILLWTFLEYMLHRHVFHMQLNEKTKPWLCTFHFMIHGLHHKVPFDPMRLVFPPLAAVILCVVFYTPLSFIVPRPRVLLAGCLLGYLGYDMIHYYLHYGNPSLKQLYFMKRYHYQHHFAHQDIGYGVSNPLWDFVFKTRIHLRKLTFHLKWK
ncbi:fatty acid 2-hydroxylase isoform X1 [Musca autumnalis]|uniref:fatty acid 2-hydroxylase isoform X1 n=1 Tax=Musca autumnalis TaxID=221902 RepID=UPI003CE911CB